MPTPEEDAAAAAAAASKPWHDGLDADTTGYFQNRGLLDKPARDVIIETAKAHRNAEKALGVPADRLIRLPADINDKAGWNEVHTKLGRPAKPEDYVLAAAGEGETDKAFLAFAQKTMHELNLPKSAGESFWVKLSEYFKTNFTKSQEAAESQIAVDKVELGKSWGANQKANEVIVENAARALDVTPEELAKGLGYKKTMELLHTIGSKIGEDKFVLPNAQGGRITTREQALARLTERKADTAFVARYMAGDLEAKTEMSNLHALAYAQE